MKRFLGGLILTVALVSGVFLAGHAQAQAPLKVAVTESDFSIALANMKLPAGTPITFVITNNGPSKHELVLEHTGDVDKALEVSGKTYEADDIEPGTTRTVEWTVPATGSFQLACHIPGHFEAGMKTTFTAVPAAPVQLQSRDMSNAQWPAIFGVLALVALGAGLMLVRRRQSSV